jgi:hypothetical protein
MHSGNPLYFRASLHVIAAAAAAACLGTTTDADAAVVISSDATQNMTCSGGVCAPTAANAVLNTSDLENLLAAGNAEVTTTGAGVQAKDIQVKAPVTWSSGSMLTLDAFKSITIDQPVSITGLAGLALDTNDGGRNGTLSFGAKGNVTFANLASGLTIDGSAYVLVGDLKTLASDIASNPGGDFALAGCYDASGDGTYNGSVVSTEYFGIFTGLGNTISNPSIVGGHERGVGNGMFALVGNTGVLENIGIVNANIVATEAVKYVNAGPLAGDNSGTIAFAYSTGSVTIGKDSQAGGLVGINAGIITNSYAKTDVAGKGTDIYIGGLVGYDDPTATIANSHASGALSLSGGAANLAGGLVGGNFGTVETSYATGNVRAANNQSPADSCHLGGLAGTNDGPVSSSYASGAVRGGNYSVDGGLIGQNYNTIASSYSTGAVQGGATGSIVGGLIGYDGAQAGSLSDTYWDTDTSGVTNLSQGAGNITNDPGITGLTTAQFQSGLPQGFDPKIWAEKANIIDGFPYLRTNPPSK